MKKLAIMLVAAVFVASLVACGCTDKNAANNGTSGTTQNGGTTQTPSPRPGTNSGTNNNGTSNNGMNNNGSMNNSDVNNGIGNDLENAVDDMGNAVDDLLGGNNHNNTNNNHNNGTNNSGANNNVTGNGTTGNNANPTSFQQMISNARVHDTDGILTDGENSHS